MSSTPRTQPEHLNGVDLAFADPPRNLAVAPEPASRARTMLDLCSERDLVRSEVLMGDPAKIEAQHAKGKLTARERITLLLDEGTFFETEILRKHRGAGLMSGNTDRPHTDGVVTGSGEIHGRPVFVYAQDFTILGGSLGESHAAKIQKTIDRATKCGAPIISLLDSGGARIQEGAHSLDGYGGIFKRTVDASGVIPQISVILGPCAGGAAYAPALTDFTFMVRDVSYMYLTGPDVVAAVNGHTVTHDELGGPTLHSTSSGVAAFVYDDEADCLSDVRFLVSMLPANYLDVPPSLAACGATSDVRPVFRDLVPVEPRVVYDMSAVVAELVDDGDFLEVHENWARNVVCGLARIDGAVVGIVANQPQYLAGALDADGAQKASRFVRFCDAFNIPLVTLVDVPGFLPGLEQERLGAIRHGAKLLYAFCEATVPRVQVIVRKAYGGAYIVMDSRSIGTDLSLAWPTTEVGVMGAAAAVNVLHRRELATSPNPAGLRSELEARYEALSTPYLPAEEGFVDDVIDPAQTRAVVARGLAMLRSKRGAAPDRKHGNLPL
ncbi:acyl-CoA carboxylase subunit beta [Kribbella sp. CA-294648]|uniref:acyl-CoA carboxylase subunit beta n=1 Tax=Kribbella sp. CA-294648 TaxID=3239948 RepID=UPI003D8A6E04